MHKYKNYFTYRGQSLSKKYYIIHIHTQSYVKMLKGFEKITEWGQYSSRKCQNKRNFYIHEIQK